MARRTQKVMGGTANRAITPPIRKTLRQWQDYAAQNGVMFQFFHWEYPADGSLWRDLAAKAPELANAGFTNIWIPPAYKGTGGATEVGYAVYDLFDLGEFDQKGTTRTKYGTKDELCDAIAAVHDAGMTVTADVVLNHRDGGDEIETVPAREVAWNDRTKFVGEKQDIEAYTRFNFPSRKEKYSTMQWNWGHFTGTAYNAALQNTEHLYVFGDKQFSGEVSREFGSYDFLMGCDVDFYNEEVKGEMRHWGEWFVKETGADGLRLDAVKHIPHPWFPHWLRHLRDATGKELFTVGEYLSQDTNDLMDYLDNVEGCMSLFDFPLHHNLYDAAKRGHGNYPMNCLLEDTLLQKAPLHAVTFVDNHDTQPGQALESFVDGWFKPHSYALILLRQDGFPCVFHVDYYGAEYEVGGKKITMPSHRFLIDKYLEARRTAGWGDQHDHFDHPNTVGWVRTGNKEHPRAMAVVMTNGTAGTKNMCVHKPNVRFVDVTEHIEGEIVSDENGCADFRCDTESVSVWVETA